MLNRKRRGSKVSGRWVLDRVAREGLTEKMTIV